MRKILTLWIALAATAVVMSAPVSAQWGCRSFGQQGGTGCNSSIATGGGGSYTGPGDVNGAAVAWWGLRAYNAAYAAPGTNPAADVIASGNGVVVCTLRIATTGGVDLAGSYCAGTTPALACAAANGGSCKVAQLYDQTGNGNHVASDTLARMPLLTFSAVGSLPGMTFSTASTSYLSSASVTGGPAQPFTVSYVAKRTGSTAALSSVFGGGGVAVQTGFDATAGNLYIYGGNVATFGSGTITEGNFHAVQNIYITSTTSTINADGASSGALNEGSGDLTTATTLVVGAAAFGGGNGLTGVILECGVWAGNKSANTSSMNSNQHTYWGF
jgi:hypothetical protein